MMKCYKEREKDREHCSCEKWIITLKISSWQNVTEFHSPEQDKSKVKFSL